MCHDEGNTSVLGASSTRLAILKTKNSIAETRGETLTSDRFGDGYIELSRLVYPSKIFVRSHKLNYQRVEVVDRTKDQSFKWVSCAAVFSHIVRGEKYSFSDPRLKVSCSCTRYSVLVMNSKF